MAISLSLMTKENKKAIVKGRELTFSALTLADLAHMQEWFKDWPLEQLQSMLGKVGEHMTPDSKNEAVQTARKEYETRARVINHLEPDREVMERVSDNMQTLFSSIDGVARLMWLSVRRTHTELTYEQVKELVDIETLEATQALMDSISYEQQDPDADLSRVDFDPEKKKAV